MNKDQFERALAAADAQYNERIRRLRNQSRLSGNTRVLDANQPKYRTERDEAVRKATVEYHEAQVQQHRQNPAKADSAAQAPVGPTAKPEITPEEHAANVAKATEMLEQNIAWHEEDKAHWGEKWTPEDEAHRAHQIREAAEYLKSLTK